MKPLTAGAEIDAWCTKCRMNLLHRIVAMVSGRPKRVICMTCNSEHNYRQPKDSSGPSPTRPSPTKAKSTAAVSSQKARAEAERVSDWERRTTGQSPGEFTRYSIDQKYQADQLISHRKFGDGYVVEILADDKIVVMFRAGQKTLVQAR